TRPRAHWHRPITTAIGRMMRQTPLRRAIPRRQSRKTPMPVTYTNRKGVTYTLCRKMGADGKAHFAFTRQCDGEPVAAEAFDVEEVNRRLAALRCRGASPG